MFKGLGSQGSRVEGLWFQGLGFHTLFLLFMFFIVTIIMGAPAIELSPHDPKSPGPGAAPTDGPVGWVKSGL